MISIRLLGLLGIAVGVTCAGCAAVPGVDSTGEPENASADNLTEQVAAAEQELVNGTVVPSDYSGFVALEYLSSTLGGYANFCSGTLINNSHIITAKHCMTQDFGGRTVYARMGSQRIAISKYRVHPTEDVAVLRLASGMIMINWQTDHVAWPPLSTTGYQRQLDNSDPASFNGATMYCRGYGPGNVVNAKLTSGSFLGFYNSGTVAWRGESALCLQFGATSTAPGDSGMGCSASPSPMYAAPLAYVHTGSSGTYAFGPTIGPVSLWIIASMITMSMIF